AMDAINLFNQWWDIIKFHTYIASISEHDDTEDLNGRLSMWRAFGGNNATRVAIVFNVPLHSEGSDALNLMFSPVDYLQQDEVHDMIYEVMEHIKANKYFIGSLDRNIVVGYVFQMLLAGVTCLKHEGFREEREWRAIYNPKLRNSPLIKSAVEVIHGAPQTVYKLPLDVDTSPLLADLDFSNIFNRLIIGASAYPSVTKEAFISILEEIGVSDAKEKVFISGIPVRSYFLTHKNIIRYLKLRPKPLPVKFQSRVGYISDS
ncbi:MAG: DUF2971 domain-containing protein, partial [Pseudomonadota bacterium]